MVKIGARASIKDSLWLKLHIIRKCIVIFIISCIAIVTLENLKIINSKFSRAKPRSESTATRNSRITNSLLQEDGWKIVDWSEAADTTTYTCRWTTFNSTSGETVQMCVHSFEDSVSDRVISHGRWDDCDELTRYWSKGIDSEKGIYVEIGANIGACVIEMLLSTDANIIAFEPHPRNRFCLHSTISKLSYEYQNRVALIPVALGNNKRVSTIYSARGNMGNSVVGKMIKDFDSQVFDEAEQANIHLERLDSVLSTNIDVKLMKIDAQGFECNVLEGMGADIAKKIQQVKFEWARKWLFSQNCYDLLPRFRNFGFELYHNQKIFEGRYSPKYLAEFYAKRIDLNMRA